MSAIGPSNNLLEEVIETRSAVIQKIKQEALNEEKISEGKAQSVFTLTTIAKTLSEEKNHSEETAFHLEQKRGEGKLNQAVRNVEVGSKLKITQLEEEEQRIKIEKKRKELSQSVEKFTEECLHRAMKMIQPSGGAINETQAHAYILEAVEQKNELFLDKLCSRVGLESRDRDDFTVLGKVARKGNLAAVQLLLKKGAKTVEIDKKGRHLVHLAAKSCNIQLFVLVLNQEITDKCGRTALHSAASAGFLDAVRLLDFKASLDEKRETPLIKAVKHGRLNIVQELYSRGHKGDDKLLKLAAERGHAEVLIWLIETGLSLKKEEPRFQPLMDSALQAAVRHGKVIAAQELVKRGANVEVKDQDLASLLHLAAESNSTAMLEWLSLPITADKYERKPLQTAVLKGKKSAAIALQTRDPDPFSIDVEGNTLLHLAVLSGSLEMVKLVFGWLKEEDINITNNLGRTSIALAVAEGQMEIGRELLKQGANKEITDGQGNTLLHLNCLREKTEIEDWLLMSNALVLENSEGMTPLLCAVLKGNVEKAKKLADKGAKTALKNKKGENILHLAVRSRSQDMVEWALGKQSSTLSLMDSEDFTPFMRAILLNEVGIAELLLDHGADIAQVRRGWSALHIAAQAGSLNILNWPKMTLPMDIFIQQTHEHEGMTPLQIAILHRKQEFVEKLIEKKAQTGPFGAAKMNLLHCVAEDGSEEMAKYLLGLNLGTALHDKDAKGNTPFAKAIQKGFLAIAKLFWAKEAKLHCSTEGNRTLFSLAASCNDKNKMVEWLLERFFNITLQDAAIKTLLKSTLQPSDIDFSQFSNLEQTISSPAVWPLLCQKRDFPLMIALHMGEEGVVDHLLKHGFTLDLPFIAKWLKQEDLKTHKLSLPARFPSQVIKILAQNCSQLVALEIGGNMISQLFTRLSPLKDKLRSLHLTTQVKPDFSQIFNPLAQFGALEYLCLDRFQMDDTGVENLLKFLPPNISKLTFDENAIGDTGVSKIASATIPKLNWLSLRKNSIGSDGAKTLSQLKSLKKLDLRENPGITREAAKTLRTQLNGIFLFL